jgi:hypothetical protein
VSQAQDELGEVAIFQQLRSTPAKEEPQFDERARIFARSAREESGDRVLRYRTSEFFTVFSEKMSISAGPYRLYAEGCPEVCTK